MTANPIRGEIPLTVQDKTFTLCLTLGALAEIEEKLGIEDLTKIDEVFKAPKASTILELVVALLHGGASAEDDASAEQKAQFALTVDDVKKWKIGLSDVFKPVMQAFEASTLLDEDGTAKK